MAEVVIFGYLGNGNLGDETNLRELVKFFRKEGSQFNLTVITASPESTSQKNRVNVVGRCDFGAIGSALKRADFLVGCGGSLFQDRTSLRSLIYYALVIIAAHAFRTKIMLYGQGIGPISSRVGKIFARFALAFADVITVRDRLSVIALMEMNLQQPEIYFTAEPLLSVPAVSRETIDTFWKERKSTVKFGLILKSDPARHDFWKRLLGTLKWEQKYQVFLIVVAEQDGAYNRELASSCGTELMMVADNWELCQSVVGGMQFVFSSRLHGLVSAVTQEIPCCGLSTDPKIDGFCLQWNIPFVPLTQELDQVALYNRMADLLAQSLTGEYRPVSQIDFWRVRSLENQMVLREFLKR